MNRRTFLQSSVMLPAMVTALGGVVSAQPNHGSRFSYLSQSQHLERIGVQLYTVRSLLSSDYENTIRAVADLGYDEVECVWDPDRNPEDIRTLFEEVGLAAPSTHAPTKLCKTT